MSEFMVRNTPEERQAGLDAWLKWKAVAEKTVKFEFGAVIQAVQRIGQGGLTESPNQASNFAFAEADTKDEVVNALQSHPHLKREGASIDVLELLSMPG
jgi:hypothetical protein